MSPRKSSCNCHFYWQDHLSSHLWWLSFVTGSLQGNVFHFCYPISYFICSVGLDWLGGSDCFFFAPGGSITAQDMVYLHTWLSRRFPISWGYNECQSSKLTPGVLPSCSGLICQHISFDDRLKLLEMQQIMELPVVNDGGNPWVKFSDPYLYLYRPYP
jgi:hypothetical protein